MAGIDAVLCGETTYYEITCCSGNKLLTGDIAGYAPLGVGPIVQTHSFDSNYTITVAGHVIPIVRTTRAWSSTLESSLGQPTGPVRGIWSGGAIYGTFCDPFTQDSYTTAVSENCVIEKSTLHYLDLRYGVCLYRYVRESVVFSKSESDTISNDDDPHLSKSSSRFIGPYGREIYWKIALDMNDIPGNCFEEWRLVINGQEQVLTHTDYTKYPVSERYISGVPCGGEEKTGEILIFPSPGTYSNPVDCDVTEWGWYKNGEPPLEVNYFYPDWCKALHSDPLWVAAEAARRSAVIEHNPIPSPSTTYTPPPITVDPIPRGSFVRHPAVGDVYQFLLSTYGGGSQVTTSPDLTVLLDSKLPADSKTHDTTLYYPISRI